MADDLYIIIAVIPPPRANNTRMKLLILKKRPTSLLVAFSFRNEFHSCLHQDRRQISIWIWSSSPTLRLNRASCMRSTAPKLGVKRITLDEVLYLTDHNL